MRARDLALLTVALGTALPAHALFEDDEARAQIKKLEARVARIETEGGERDRRALFELVNQIEGLRREMSMLRGQIEVLANRVESLDKRQKDLYVDIDTRLRKLEQAAEQQAAVAAAKTTEAEPGEEEKRAYEGALNQFKLGNYSAAIDLMQQLLLKYPNSKLAPNAQYWIGMGYSGRRDYRNAITALQRVIDLWPTDPKAADAMLSVSSAQEAMGDVKAAQATLQNVLAKYPGSTAADQARLRLQQSVRR